MTIFCVKCGTGNPDGAQFCFKCGTAIAGTAGAGAPPRPLPARPRKRSAGPGFSS